MDSPSETSATNNTERNLMASSAAAAGSNVAPDANASKAVIVPGAAPAAQPSIDLAMNPGSEGNSEGSLVELAIATVERLGEKRKDRIADAVSDIATQIRTSTRRFEGEQEWLASAIEKGANKVVDLADDLRATEIRDLLAQTRIFVRQRPRLFIAGAVTATALAVSLARRAWDDFQSREATSRA